MSAKATLLLFVYGSLKRAEANHVALGGARFVGEARTLPAFALREIAGYPALVPGERAISGELFEFDRAQLPELDAFEGCAYVRREVELEGGRVATTYFARDGRDGVELPVSEWANRGDSR